MRLLCGIQGGDCADEMPRRRPQTVVMSGKSPDVADRRERTVFTAKPTKEQLAWQDMELGVLIHYCMEIYRPDLRGDWYKTDAVREALAPETIHPKKLEPAQWVRSAAESFSRSSYCGS